jgi:hypothetical protein
MTDRAPATTAHFKRMDEASEAYARWLRGTPIWQGYFDDLSPYQFSKIQEHGNTTNVKPEGAEPVRHQFIETYDREEREAAERQAKALAAALAPTLTALAPSHSQPRKRSTAVLGGCSLAELEAQDIPAREAVLTCTAGTLFFQQSINQILAHRGTGKTLLGLSFAGAMANGTDVLGFHAARPMRVMYLDGELPLSQLRERAALLASGPHSKENLFLINPEQSKPVESIRLLDDSTWGQLLRKIEQHQSQVIVLDSYSTLFWLDANKEEAQIATQMRLNELRTHGLCVIALQHTGKDKKTQRGHSRNEDGLDTQILLERPESAPAGRVAFDISFPKVRHEANFEPSGTWTLQAGLWSMQASVEDIAIREYLSQGKGINWIARDLHVGDRRVMRIRQEMRAEGVAVLNEKTTDNIVRKKDNGKNNVVSG